MPRPDWIEPYLVAPDPSLTWEVIVGLPHVKTALQSLCRRIVAASSDDETASLVASTLPRGVLLTGAPGTGKTLTARVLLATLAREGRGALTMVNLPAADMTVERFADLTAWMNNRHDEGDDGQVVLFLDEVDVWASRRTPGPVSGAYRSPVLLAALTCLDGLDQRDRQRHRTLALMATNAHPEGLDAALTRSGRTDMTVSYPYPDLDERAALFAHYLRPFGPLPDGDIRRAARIAGGRSTPADIESLVHEAVGLALDEGTHRVSWCDLEAALRRQGRIDPERPLSGDAARRVALHEAGHILASARLLGPQAVSMAILHSSRASGRPDGLTETEEDANETKASALARITVCVAGLAAEQVVLGDDRAGTGSSADFAQALALVRRLGRNAHLVDLDIPPVSMAESAAYESLLLSAGGRVLDRALDQARRLIGGDLSVLLSIADRIGAQGSLTADEIEQLVG